MQRTTHRDADEPSYIGADRRDSACAGIYAFVIDSGCLVGRHAAHSSTRFLRLDGQTFVDEFYRLDRDLVATRLKAGAFEFVDPGLLGMPA
jgi:hypothetical protein